MEENPAAKPVRLLPFERRVLGAIRKHRMLAPGDRVLAGISGGADSVALLHCLKKLTGRLRLGLTAAHLNHGLRGAESDADEEFVRKLCAALNVACLCGTRRVGDAAAAEKINLEEAGREARYEFLRRMAQRAGAGRIAVGHTQNDQAETVLLRLMRGSGVDGLAAIHPVAGGTVIRPLIEVSRREVLAYLEEVSAEYRDDSSNLDLRYRRNRLRHESIPYLEKEFNPRLVETLAREAGLARELSSFLHDLAAVEFERLRLPARECGRPAPQPGPKDPALQGAEVALAAGRLQELHPFLQKLVLREAVRAARGSLRGVTSGHIEEILRLCAGRRSGRRSRLPGGITAIRQFEQILLVPEPATGTFEHVLPIPGSCIVPELEIEITASLTTEFASGRPLARAHLERDSLPSALLVRSRLPGDRYGGPGHRKVKKMLINAKVGLRDRDRLPMITAGDAVVWIPGFRPAGPFRAKSQSGQYVALVVTARETGGAKKIARRMET